MRLTSVAFCLLYTCAAASAQELIPFVLPWDDGTPGPTDCSGFLPKPAGHVRVGDGGHLYIGETRIRFLGTNLCFGGCFPTKPAAEAIAGRMAKFGINAVRFHHMDSQQFPGGIRARNAANTRELDAEALERLDYLVYQLKQQGIYSDLNLLVSRRFVAADGLPPEIEQVEWKDQHVAGFFYAPLLELQKEYARKLLTHRNPYTKTTYLEEPAIALIEINNENGLLHGWFGQQVDRLPAVFLNDLRRQWNDWLKAHYRRTDALQEAWKEGEASVGAEMLRSGADGWYLETHQGAAAVSSKDGGVEIHIARAGTEGWHVQYSQSRLNVAEDKPYTLTFRAKADAAATIGVGVSQAHEPWAGLGWSVPVRLKDEWQTFRFVIRPTDGDANARLMFSGMGARIGAYSIADVSLRPGGVAGLQENESVETSSVNLLTRAEYGERSVPAQRDWIRFLWETEANYWRTMRRFVQEELGAKSLVVGTIVACSTPNLMAEFDVVDTHAYWQHPVFPNRSWDREDWYVRNESMVNTPGGVLADLAKQRVVGKPLICTEYNHSAPNTYSSEAPLLLAAFAALQDWDGVFLFAYSHRQEDWNTRRISNFFDIDQHPTKMANLPLAAAMLLRGDVSPATEWTTAALSPEEELDAIRRRGRAWSVAHGGLIHASNADTVTRRVGLRVGETPSAPPPGEEGRVADAAKSEIVWNVSRPKKGVVTVNAPKTKAVVGFVDGQTFSLDDVTITPGQTSQDWCTVGLTVLEGDPFASLKRALLVATGYAENTDTVWKNGEKNSVGANWGKAPSLVEVVPATVTLPIPANRLQVWALDKQGQRRERVVVRAEGKNSVVEIGRQYGTLWYEMYLR